MTKPITGIHHVTAIASDPQRNLDFYTEILGLRLVKRTINFDDPGTYHFYFGDETGQPGTILTFFPWPQAVRGSAGAGEVGTTSFNAPPASIDFWEQRLLEAGLPAERSGRRFGEEVLSFADPDGMRLEIVGHAQDGEVHPWPDASVPSEHALRGFFGVTLVQHELSPTERVLSAMGYRKIAEEGERHRFAVEGGAPGSHVDVLVLPSSAFARLGAGSVHHVAFRMADDESQLDWRKLLSRERLDLTPVIDRMYFHSVYFREPGGVLFELATDPPGFTWDEPEETLGESLKLPEWLEPRRDRIEQILPLIDLRKPVKVQA